MGKTKFTLLRFARVFSLIVVGLLSIWNPLNKNYTLRIFMIYLCVSAIFEWIFLKNEMKRNISFLIILLIFIFAYFVI